MDTPSLDSSARHRRLRRLLNTTKRRATIPLREVPPTIIVSGVHSGVNPSPGLGTARSLRYAWPRVRIEALDYSTKSTGLNSSTFSECNLFPPWRDVDLGASVDAIFELIERKSAIFISGLDLEAELLSQRAHKSVLVPPTAALKYITKAETSPAARTLNLDYPDTIIATDLTVAGYFAESHGWPVWVKGPNYEALSCGTPAQLAANVSRAKHTWGAVPLIQEHIDGPEESLCFVAHQGELLMACAMRKTSVTDQGKTWGGAVRGCTEDELVGIRGFVRATGWSGGAEAEIVRQQRTGRRYLIDLNPRFPAWIHGATIAGYNMPAALVAASTGVKYNVQAPESTDFARIVIEIPSRFASHESEMVISANRGAIAKGHPSGMPELSRRRKRANDGSAPPSHVNSGLAEVLAPDLALVAAAAEGPTPQRVLMELMVSARLSDLQRIMHSLSGRWGLDLQAAYSMKTNHDDALLRLIRRSGLMVETISQEEIRRATEMGFLCSDIILNGPGKWWSRSPISIEGSVAGIFSDSVSDLAKTITLVQQGRIRTSRLGIRVASPLYSSRFGIDLCDRRQFLETVSLLSSLPQPSDIAIHSHVAASAIGFERWQENLIATLHLASAVADAAEVQVICVDFGGGWGHQSLDSDLGRELDRAMAATRLLSPGARSVLIEPGKLIAQPSFALATRVLSVESREQGRRVAVVDASIADVSDSASPARPVAWRAGETGEWVILPAGDDQIFGRICMESDVLHPGLTLPEQIVPGDLVAFLDTGAYDMSMSYDFGS
jgi:diaminopimelate decarboxylase